MAASPEVGSVAQVAIDVVGASGPIVMWAALVVFNVAVIKLLQISLKNIDLKEVLREKATLPSSTSTSTTTVPAAGDGNPAQTTVETSTTPGGKVDQASYSRVAGMVGATVLGCFLWAVANIVIYKAFAAPNDVPSLLQNIGGFFLAGASLFAPYAFNQLSTTFKSN